MTWTDLDEAIAEAGRFLAKAAAPKKLRKPGNGDDIAMAWAPRESGSVRLASMDLTRILAKLRNGR